MGPVNSSNKDYLVKVRDIFIAYWSVLSSNKLILLSVLSVWVTVIVILLVIIVGV
jgi:hypothetical protein